jgi:hypothetical protein
MDPDLVTVALSGLKRIRVRISEDTLHVHVPSINDGFSVPVERIHWIHRTPSPTGGHALALELCGYDVEQPLIVTDDDFVFPPFDPASLLDSTVKFQVSNAPPLVAYSEMERDAARIAAVCTDLRGRNLAELTGSVLLIRSFIMGAVRFGARPLRTAAWWHRSWELAGDMLFLPAFRKDPTWDALAVDAAAIVL